MTDVVNPSFNRVADSFLMSGTIDGLSVKNDYIVASTESPTVLATDQGLNTGALNGFQENSSPTSTSVTIEGGEAFVTGTWLARDQQSSVALQSSTNNQTVYVGWVDGSPNNVTIGLDTDFSSTDQKIAVWSFDTDSNGVTSVTDKRTIGTEIDFFDGDADITTDGNDIRVTTGDDTDAFVFGPNEVESLRSFIAPDFSGDQISLGNQATNTDHATRYDQFQSLESTVSNKADNPHDNAQHSETYLTGTEVDTKIQDHQNSEVHVQRQPPQDHDHSQSSGDGGSTIDLSSGQINLPVRSSDPSPLTDGLFWVRDDL